MRALLVLLSGCALVSKSPPLETRHFAPPPPEPAATTAPHQGPRLRLARVEPSSHLRKRIVHRASPVEVGMYETRWWTEDPETYVQRALEQVLFAERGFTQALDASAVTLDVDLTAFEEVHAPRHAGRVELRYSLRDDRDVIASGVVAVERPVSGPDFDAVVAAIGTAMDAASREVADRVVDQLGH